MKLFYTGKRSSEPRPYEAFNKIAAIKCLRNHTGMGLKESKEAIELATEHGEAEVDIRPGYNSSISGIDAFNQAFRAAEPSIYVESELSELTNLIERGIAVAVSLREYKTARALINTLPRDLRSLHLDSGEE